jgi:hypothetical protein
MQRKSVTHLVKGIDTEQYRCPLTVAPAADHKSPVSPGCARRVAVRMLI